MIQSGGYTDYASITPFVARTISQKLDAHVFICGSINLAGPTLRINAQLIDSNSDEVFKAFQIDGTADKILPVIDSLALEVKNFLIISNLKKGVSSDDYQRQIHLKPTVYFFWVIKHSETLIILHHIKCICKRLPLTQISLKQL
jgi:hypothetical protein